MTSSQNNGISSAYGALVPQALNVAGAAFLLLMMMQVLLNVVSRYFFNSPIANTHELVGYWYLPAVALLGFVTAKLVGEHIDAPLIFYKLPIGSQRVLALVSALLGIAVCLLFANYTFLEALAGTSTQSTAGTSSLPIWPILYLPPLVFMVLAALFLVDAVRVVKAEADKDTEMTES